MDPDMAIGVIVFSAVFGALVFCYLAAKYLGRVNDFIDKHY